MSIEQTKWFAMDVDHAVAMAKEGMYLIGWNEEATEYRKRYETMRGVAAAKKVFAKANQRLKKKAY